MACKIVIGVISFNRPNHLVAALRSIERQKIPSDCSVQVVVLENHPNGRARELLASQAWSIDFEVIDFRRANISLGRNRLLEESRRSDFLVFVDDDVILAPNALLHLYLAAESRCADAVIGNNVRLPSRKLPRSLESVSPYYRIPLSEVPSAPFVYTTALCLLRSSTIRNSNERFDEPFGQIGGGDKEYFMRLEKQGKSVVFCLESVSYEILGPERCNWQWAARRSLRCGGALARTHQMLFPQQVSSLCTEYQKRLLESIRKLLLVIVYRSGFSEFGKQIQNTLTAFGYLLFAHCGLAVVEYGSGFPIVRVNTRASG